MKTRIGFGILLLAAAFASAAFSLPGILAALRGPSLTAAFADPWLPWAFTAAIALQLLGHLVRSEKHSLMLREIRPIGRDQVFRGQMIGFMFNALLPFRLGEVMRAHYVGRAVQISRAAVFATIVFERCIDLFVVCCLGALVLALDPATAATGFGVIVGSASLLLVATIGGLFACYRQPRWLLVAIFHSTGLLNDRLRDRSRHIAWSFCHALRYAVPQRILLVRYLCLALVMWAAYLGSLLAIVVSLRPQDAPAGQALGLADVPYLGVTNWRGMGVFQIFQDRVAVLAVPWLPSERLLAFAILVWVILVVPSIVLGAFALMHRDLVEHIAGRGDDSARANKLFRDVDASAGFAHMLGSHFRGEHLGRVVSREEALGRFTVVKALKGGSHASTLLVWEDDALIVKKITLPEHASKLRSQYDWLRARAGASQLVNAVGVREEHDYFSIDIEFREGFVSFFEHLHATTPSNAWALLDRMLDFTAGAVYAPTAAREPRAALDRYIRTKALGKITETASASPTIATLLTFDSIVVNGERFSNFHRIVESISRNERAMADLCDFTEGPIHGDLTIDNMMVDPAHDDFMIIDPNDENAISDPLVDHAKLLQSLHSGYEFLLLHDHASVDVDRITFEERKSAHYQHLHDRFTARLRDELTPGRFRSLLFHEALHYCRMLPYRAAINPDSVALYYGIAVRLLNRFVAQYDDRSAVEIVAVGDREPLLA